MVFREVPKIACWFTISSLHNIGLWKKMKLKLFIFFFHEHISMISRVIARKANLFFSLGECQLWLSLNISWFPNHNQRWLTNISNMFFSSLSLWFFPYLIIFDSKVHQKYTWEFRNIIQNGKNFRVCTKYICKWRKKFYY